MILLQGHSISPLKKIPLEEMSLQLKERDSTATIVPADMDGITVNSWMVDDTEPGKGIVWRVNSISQAYATRTPTVQLEHAINTLKDRIMFGEHKPKDITGNSKATTATAEQTIRYILSNQSDWVLWRFDYAGTSNPYQFDGDTLFDALETVTSSLKNAWWTYDMTVYPFRLNIIRKDNTAYSELRPGRNLKTITKTIDKSGMYTRFYPIGKDDLHLSDYAVDRNTEYYGVISKVDTDASIDTEAELRRWANERLDDHAEPTVTIDVEGLDLADATGEELDRMWLGYCCRIPLAEFGTTINERIVGLTFPDKLRQPEVVKVTLSNNRTDLTKIIADSMKSSGKGKRTSTKQDKEDHAWFEDTDDHVAMCAEALIGRDKNGVNWYRLSSIIVDGEGIHQKVEATDGKVTKAYTLIDQNEQRIKLEAKRASDAEGELQGKITVQADRITQEVTERKDGEVTLQGKITVQADRITNEVTRAVNEERSLRGALEVEADRVGMVVGYTDTRPIRYIYQTQYLPRPGDPSVIYYCQDSKKYYEWNPSTNSYIRTTPGQFIKAGEIVESINEAGETEAHIDADKVYIGNSKSTTVINGKLNASDFTANNISAQLATLAQVTVNGLNVIGDVYVRNGAGSQQNVAGAIWDIQLTGPVNGVYTLKRRRINESDYTDIGTFSRATSLSGQWSGGELTVTASPQGNTFRADLFTGGHWGYASGEDKKTYYGSISAKHNGGSTSYSTGEYFEVDASSIYDDGYDAGYDLGLDDGWYAYYDSSKWEAPSSSNGWKAKIPTRASSSQNETWLTLTNYSQWHPNSLSMYCTEGGQVPGTSIFRYKFTVEASSDWGYVSGKSYPFYY